MSQVRFLPLTFLVVAFLLCIESPKAAAQENAQAAQLRYGWKEGQIISYEVKVEVDRDKYVETYSGTPTYVVQKAGKDGIELEFRGKLRESREAKPGNRVSLVGPRGRGGLRSPFTGLSRSVSLNRHELTINSRGELIEMKGSSQLPLLLGNLSQLILEPLPEDAAQSWSDGRNFPFPPQAVIFPERCSLANRNAARSARKKRRPTKSASKLPTLWKSRKLMNSSRLQPAAANRFSKLPDPARSRST